MRAKAHGLPNPTELAVRVGGSPVLPGSFPARTSQKTKKDAYQYSILSNFPLIDKHTILVVLVA
jgi:hypothetical protein